MVKKIRMILLFGSIYQHYFFASGCLFYVFLLLARYVPNVAKTSL